ncbi:putative tudor domain-containing protein 1 isoform X8 [Apostichopus japonicus]|uniref:Putative tudor domain-containing protein 1 isoform X8 n=1 Tax=Stichopus japonicus TaxID=307972 RepID=A0A2G8L174_STIJA|nr:putative tudor domain-containing protein 1 isoform X8 [Apostichopus japonicus]
MMPHTKGSRTKVQQADGLPPAIDGLEGDVECSPKQGKTPRRPTSRGSQGRDKGGKRDKGDRRSQGSSESNNNHTPASSDMAFRDREWEPHHNLDSWDPMADDFESSTFNSYNRPSVDDLARDFHGQDLARRSDASSGLQIYVTGIPQSMDEKGLSNLFSTAGSVRRVKVCVGKPDKPGTYGFVTMNSVNDVHQAIRKLDGYRITGELTLGVRIARDKSRSDSQYGILEGYQQGKVLNERGRRNPSGNNRSRDYYDDEDDGEESPVYYSNINCKSLHQTEEDDREIMESGGELKVHVRRTNSREYNKDDDDGSGHYEKKRDKRGQTSRRGRGGHRPVGGVRRSSQGEDQYSEDSHDGETYSEGSSDGKNKTKRKQGRRSPTPEEFEELFSSQDAAKLTLMQQQMLFMQLAALNPFRMNLPHQSISIQPALLNPNTLGLLAPQLQQQMQQPTMASVEDITSPEMPKKSSKEERSERVTNGEETPKRAGSHGQHSPGHKRDSTERDKSSIRNGRSSIKGSDDDKSDSRSGATEILASIGGKVSTTVAGKATTERLGEKQPEKKKDKPTEVRLCLSCDQPGKKKCSVCQSPYCSSQCQRDHWPKHQHECKKIKADGVDKATKGSCPISPRMTPSESRLQQQRYEGMTVSAGDIPRVKPERKQMNVVVVHSQSPTSFWVQLMVEKNISGYSEMQELMYSTFDDPKMEFPPVTPRVSHIYACLSEDVWYRSLVLAPPAGGKVRVQYIDYGDEDSIPLKNFRLLNGGMTQLPLQGLKCRLTGITPTGGEWSKDACEQFFALVSGEGKLLLVNFLQPKEGDKEAYITKMIDETGLDIIGELLKAGVANKEEKSKPRSIQPSPSHSVKPKANLSSPQEVKSQPKGVSPPQVKTKAATVPSTKLNKTQIPPPIWQTLKEGDTLIVEVSGILSHSGKFYAYLHQNLAAMVEQQESLQAYYQKSTPNPIDQFRRGELIVSLYSVDGNWYRARVISDNATTVKVSFADYGAEEQRSCAECRKIAPEFTRLAPQCINMMLDGVADREGLPPLGEKFGEWVQTRSECQAKVVKVSQSGLVSVRLCALGDPADCINQQLEAHGYSSQRLGKAATTTSSPGPGGDARKTVTTVNQKKDQPGNSAGSRDGKSPSNSHSEYETSTSTATQRKTVVGCHQVAVMDIESPAKFWVCLSEEEEEITSFLRDMQSHYKDANPAGFRPNVGQICAAQFEGAWYRALVMSKPKGQEDSFEVFYVDYGNRCRVTADECRPLLPAHARCHRACGDVIDIALPGEQKNPYLFHAAPFSQLEKLAWLVQELQRECADDSTGYQPLMGELCSAKFQGAFYRAFVQSVSGTDVQVLFVDYGNEAKVDASECQPLPVNLRTEQMVALRCRLDATADICPEMLEAFSISTALCKLRVTRKDGDVVVGVLWVSDSPEMCFNGSPQERVPSEDVEPVSPRNPYGGESKTQSETLPTVPSDRLRDQLGPGEDLHNPAKAQGKKDSHSKQSSPRQITNPSPPYHKDIGKSSKHQNSVKSGKVVDNFASKSFVRAADISKPCAPQIGKLLPASFSNQVSPSEMYFHLNLMETLNILKEESFQDLGGTLREYHPQVGELCMGYVTNQWCRAEVLAVSGSQYKLGVLDYGYTIELSSQQLRPAQPDRLKNKIACVRCSLSGVKPVKEGTWSNSAIDFTTKQLEGQQSESKPSVIQLKVMDVVGDVFWVEVYIQAENKQFHALSEQLIINGLAKHNLDSAGPVVSIPHPLDNAELQVFVCGVINAADFYCQIVNEEGCEQLRYLMKAVNEYGEEQEETSISSQL